MSVWQALAGAVVGGLFGTATVVYAGEWRRERRAAKRPVQRLDFSARPGRTWR